MSYQAGQSQAGAGAAESRRRDQCRQKAGRTGVPHAALDSANDIPAMHLGKKMTCAFYLSSHLAIMSLLVSAGVQVLV